MRAYKRSDGGTYVFRLREHVDRLFDSCKMCLLQPEVHARAADGRLREALRVNGMVEGYIRPMVFVGEGAMGIYAPQNPIRTSVLAWKWGAYLGEEALKNGIRTKISSFARHHINVSLAKAKMTGQYTNSVLAKREAKARRLRRSDSARRQRVRERGLRRKHLRRTKGRPPHAGPVVLDSRGDHARHHHHAGARDGDDRWSRTD
jgi:branched-subunit amino acid aminotransferase/4-amino-4-deoxychorismate lyase